ncbi:hypothetical protein [Pulveribacter sp.]|uniref:hypothetical protein n=1 Tax=Pulveribacter sp. TaxID=2678893 RepID=UPI0028A920E1|nr:hypothetical protein [Pulveribacter sp.]
MWLDTPVHQATGLQGFAPEQQLRLLPVVSQPGAGSVELEMLWQLCSALQRLSYPPVVLDGTAQESERAPGLLHLLDGLPWPGGADAAPGAALAVVPAARGLARLAHAPHAGQAALPLIAGLFRSYAVAVLYAGAELLAPLLRASRSVPLVMTGPGAQGMVASYRQLKHLALHAGLPRCTVASIRPPQVQTPGRQTAEALDTLQRSALSHLGLQLHTTAIAAGRVQDIQRLALQLLENACTMDPAPTLSDQSH